MTVHEEKKYTLSEARQIQRVTACAAEGHIPDTVIKDGWGRGVIAYCDCGTVKWHPQSGVSR